MRQEATSNPAFVIKPQELPALNFLCPGHPRPIRTEWINRATDKPLKPSSVEVLLRTLHIDMASPSVVRLHRSAGLRTVFRSDREREVFANEFSAAKAREAVGKHHLVTAIFVDRPSAEQAIYGLRCAEVPDAAISLLSRASCFIDSDVEWPEGHGIFSVAGASTGAGVAGAILGVAILLVPGMGPTAAAGALISSVVSKVAAASGIIGATGGAIARMLTDHDVDGVSATYCEQQIQRGHIFLSVDTRIAKIDRQTLRRILKDSGGRSATRA